MRRAVRMTLWVLLGMVAAGSARAAPEPDVEGSRDHPLLRRFAGSTIYEYSEKDLDAAKVPQRADRCVGAEGRVTRALYVYPARSSCLQVLRDYEKQLSGLRAEVTTGTQLPDACNAWDVNGSSVQQWVAAVVGKGPAGGRSYVFVGCTEGGFDTPAGPLVVVDTKAGAAARTETFPTASTATPPVSATPSGPLAAGSAYVRVTGMRGDSADPKHAGWSDVAGFSLEVGSVQSASVSGGAAIPAGREVGVVKETDGTSDGLVPAALSGAFFPEVELHVAESDCSTYSILLKGAAVGSLAFNGTTERLGFRYQQAVLSHRPVTGAPCPGETATTATVAGNAAMAPLATDASSERVPAAGDGVAVFLRIPGVPGDSKDATHLGWVEGLGSPALGVVTAAQKATAATGAAVVGLKQPYLTVRARLGMGLPAAVAATGRGKLGSVQLELRSTGAAPRTLAAWELRGASIVTVAYPRGTDLERPGGDLTFSFDSVKVVAYRPDGTPRYSVDLPGR